MINKLKAGAQSKKQYEIKKFRSADAGMLAAIKGLIDECAYLNGDEEQILSDLSMNFKQDMARIFTYEDAGLLAGLVWIFAPGPYEIEVNALVHPDYWKRGVFKALLLEAVHDTAKYGYRRGLFVCDSREKTVEKAMTGLGCGTDHTEYQLRRLLSGSEAEGRRGELVIAEVQEDDIEELSALGASIFNIDIASERQLILRMIKSPDRVQWALKKDDRIIGLCGVRIKKGVCTILGLGIHPKERRRGYAQEMLNFIADYAPKYEAYTLCLDVDALNAPAITLYESYGFKKYSETKFFGFKFSRIKRRLKKRLLDNLQAML